MKLRTTEDKHSKYRYRQAFLKKMSIRAAIRFFCVYVCYNGFTIKIDLFKSKRFKDGRCTYKNTGSSQHKFANHFKGSNSSAKYLITKNVEVVILLDVLAYLMQSSN